MNESSAAKRLLACTVIGLAVLLGCQFEKKEQQQKPTTAAQQRAQVKENAKQSAKDWNAYLYAQKMEFRDAMRTHLDDLKTEIKKLSKDLEDSGAAAKADIQEKLRALRADETRTEAQLDNVESATEETWEDVKKATIDAYEGLKASVNSAAEWVAEKTDGN